MKKLNWRETYSKSKFICHNVSSTFLFKITDSVIVFLLKYINQLSKFDEMFSEFNFFFQFNFIIATVANKTET